MMKGKRKGQLINPQSNNEMRAPLWQDGKDATTASGECPHIEKEITNLYRDYLMYVVSLTGHFKIGQNTCE